MSNNRQITVIAGDNGKTVIVHRWQLCEGSAVSFDRKPMAINERLRQLLREQIQTAKTKGDK